MRLQQYEHKAEKRLSLRDVVGKCEYRRGPDMRVAVHCVERGFETAIQGTPAIPM